MRYASLALRTACTETALPAKVLFIQGRLKRGGYAVGIFLDIDSVYNNTLHKVVCEKVLRRDVSKKLVEGIRDMLG